MKFLLKKIFGFLGFEITKKKKILRDVEIIEHIFSPIRNNISSFFDFIKECGFYPDVVIDVGVADGTPELTNTFEKAYFVWVEPLMEFENVLKQLASDYKGEYHLCAAGKEPGKSFLNVHPDLAGSSLYAEVDGKSADGLSREISVLKLDDIVSKKLNKNILLKIDVQGAELDVLGGALELLKNTELIVLEVSLFKFQHNAPDFYDVVFFMKEKGFVVYDIFYGHNRPLDNALAQVDMVFVKENGQFRANHNWATTEQRKLINKVKQKTCSN